MFFSLILRIILLNILVAYTLSKELACVDLSRDCSMRAHLCQSQNEVDKQLMHKSCPKTCQTCSTQTAEISSHLAPRKKCMDQADDCDERIHLCKRNTYKRMMTTQCSLTCGFCTLEESSETQPPVRKTSSSSKKEIRAKILRGSTTLREIERGGVTLEELVSLIRSQETTTTNTTLCQDLGYDCLDKQGLCSNKAYTTLMAKVCRKTCNMCSSTTL